MSKHKLLITASVALTLAGTGIGTVQTMAGTSQVEAASLAKRYGAKSRFTVPKKFRGTWVSKSKKSAFKQIKLTTHTIKLSGPRGYYRHSSGWISSYSGTWKLWNQSGSWYNKHFHKTSGVKPAKYADRHKWMATRKNNANSIFFKYGWLSDNSFSFILNYKSSKKLQFDNTMYTNYYYKK